METVTLVYKRLPQRVHYFKQQLLYEDENVIVTTQRVKPSSPIIHNRETVLGDNFTAIWFVFPELWYDIGKIYNLNNQWTGYYCDIIMPRKRTETAFEIVDLFLDLWVLPGGGYEILDEDEFEAALQAGVIETELAKRARNALKDLIADVTSGKFPPPIMEKY